MTEHKRYLPAATTRFWRGVEPGTRRNPFDRDKDEQRAPEMAALRTATIDIVSRLTGTLDVVDIGCATGRVAYDMLSLQNVNSVTGIDVSPKALALATQKLKEHPRYSQRTVSLLEGDFLSDPTLLPPNAYDVVVSLELLDILADPYEGLARMYASLKPGGHLIGSWLSEEQLYKHYSKKRGRAVAAGKVISVHAMPLITKTPGVRDFIGKRGYGRENPIREADLPAVLIEQGFQIETIKPGEHLMFHAVKPNIL